MLQYYNYEGHIKLDIYVAICMYTYEIFCTNVATYVCSYVCIHVYTYALLITCHIQHYTASNSSTKSSTTVHSVIIFQCNISDHKISECSSSRVEHQSMIRCWDLCSYCSYYSTNIPTPHSISYNCYIIKADYYHTL